MTVRELIGLLSEVEPDAIVVLSADAEENLFLPVAGSYSIGKYDSAWREFWDENDPLATGQSAFLLWPEHYVPTV